MTLESFTRFYYHFPKDSGQVSALERYDPQKRYHHATKPAVIYWHGNGVPMFIEYFWHGRRHRNKGPAYYYISREGCVISQIYYRHNVPA